ncbi:MAG: gliding motility-associated C-terminal domain-containing protein [Bacteroidetes bacterium]|nr:gliding motility-associated C-terminal domain-containing protein [Bacteroidota bacterium]
MPQPLKLTATATPSDLACTGGPTGSVFTTVTGGNGPYSYWWGSGVVAPNRMNVNSGTYTVTVTDANGCSSTASATIVTYTALSLFTSKTDNVCFGVNAGTIDAVVNNGWAPYSYLWSNGSTTQNVQSLSAGSYNVTVTDNHGCTITKSATITQPPFKIVINSTITDQLCFGDSNGVISLTILNGSTPYSYNWSGGSTAQSRSGLAAGNYLVTVTDHLGCSAASSLDVNQPSKLNISSSAVNATCFGANNGQVNIDATGGWAPYTFSWSNTATTEDLLAVPAGAYSLTLTDNHACRVTTSATVNQPTPLTASLAVGHVSCNKGSNGWINTSPSGGTAPYSYNWGSGITTLNRTGISAGNYTLMVTDNAGCTFSTTASVTQPASLLISSAVTNASCNGGTNGAISLNVTGGTSSYNYLWNDGYTTQSRIGLITGNYLVTVTDFATCTATDTITVGQASSIVVSSTKVDVKCYAGSDGAIQVNVNGGTAPYSYQWSDAVCTANRSSLSDGTYYLTTTDNVGCTSMNSFVISQPSALNVTSIVNNVSCFNGTNGAIQLSATGGTSGYSYNWGGGVATQNRNAVTAGNYSVTVSDNSNCSTTHSVSISQPTELSIGAVVNDISCNSGNNGSINLSINGGVSSYTYDWGGGINSISRNNLVAGDYPVTVTDANYCIAHKIFTVSEPDPLVITTSKLDIACFAQSSGRIDVNVTGGTPSYTFDWGGSVSTQNITGVSTGTYTVTVIDNNGCSGTASEEISQPTQMSTTIFSITNPSCHGLSDGKVDIGVNGGTGPYTYLWSNGSTNKTLTNALAGNHSVTVTDANQCTALTSISLNQPAFINVAISKSDITCFGNSDGSITATASGGKNGFTYSWNTSATTPALNNLAAATYLVTVKDISNCSVSTSVVINQPSSIQVSESHQDVSCNGTASGTISILSSGGAGSHTYHWEDNSTLPNRNNLGAGDYSVTVTDVNSCSVVQNITINQTSDITIAEQHTDFACSNKPGTAIISVTGGTPPYHYGWNDGPTIKDRSNMVAGAYSVTVTDVASCSASKGVNIASLSQLNATITKTDIVCNGSLSGKLNTSVSGGLPGYSYLWNNGATTPNLSNLAAGQYEITITDGNGCATIYDETIASGVSIQINDSIQQLSCYGENNGAINVNIDGGTAPYTFNWNNNSNSRNLSNVVAGNYSITVTDANQCTSSKSNLIIHQPSEIKVQPTITPVGCSEQSSGSVELAVSGGVGPYRFSWDNQDSTAAIHQLNPGDYSVVITDQKRCAISKTFSVLTAQPVNVIGNAHNTSCPGVNNGRIELSVTGGVPGYTFEWNNGQTSKDMKQLSEGSYSVKVSDSRGCQTLTDFTITYDYDLTIQASDDASIVSGQTADIWVAANNDHRNKYTWTPAASVVCDECKDTRAFPQESTTYTVQVVDMNGCRATDTLRVEVRKVTDNIFLPNAFTPNNDGNNDVLQLFGDMSDVRQMNFVLFNRLGEKVYETDDHGFQWDGSYRGETSPMGVYRYMMHLVFADGTGKDLQGSVTILR